MLFAGVRFLEKKMEESLFRQKIMSIINGMSDN